MQSLAGSNHDILNIIGIDKLDGQPAETDFNATWQVLPLQTTMGEKQRDRIYKRKSPITKNQEMKSSATPKRYISDGTYKAEAMIQAVSINEQMLMKSSVASIDGLEEKKALKPTRLLQQLDILNSTLERLKQNELDLKAEIKSKETAASSKRKAEHIKSLVSRNWKKVSQSESSLNLQPTHKSKQSRDSAA